MTATAYKMEFAPIVLKELVLDCDISQARIAQETGMSRPTINLMLNRGYMPTGHPEVKDTVEQMLLDARVPELCAVDGKQALNYFPDSTYTYDDAVVLAKLWGEPSPWEAKVRIERNLIMGNDQVVKRALGLAQRHFNGR